ncbi:MAG: hypothetical protein ACQESC_02240 [Nanobdellota archaeon]
MGVLTINKNGQATVTIPKELVDLLDWEGRDRILVSKVPGKKHLMIENITRQERLYDSK